MSKSGISLEIPSLPLSGFYGMITGVLSLVTHDMQDTVAYPDRHKPTAKKGLYRGLPPSYQGAGYLSW